MTGAGGEGGPLGIFLFVLKIKQGKIEISLRCAANAPFQRKSELCAFLSRWEDIFPFI